MTMTGITVHMPEDQPCELCPLENNANKALKRIGNMLISTTVDDRTRLKHLTQELNMIAECFPVNEENEGRKDNDKEENES